MVPIENVYEQIRTFAADAGARKVVLFGSRAKGVNRPKSDIDLAVAGCPDFNRLEQNLQDNLWSLLNADADTVAFRLEGDVGGVAQLGDVSGHESAGAVRHSVGEIGRAHV